MLTLLNWIVSSVCVCLCSLQDNELVDVEGALQHLTNLKIIMLQNNQLTKLEDTMKEFKYMQGLETLSKFTIYGAFFKL